jgi:hypothetical protein
MGARGCSLGGKIMSEAKPLLLQYTFMMWCLVKKGKVVLKLVPRHDDVLGIGGIAPNILNLGIRWR